MKLTLHAKEVNAVAGRREGDGDVGMGSRRFLAPSNYSFAKIGQAGEVEGGSFFVLGLHTLDKSKDVSFVREIEGDSLLCLCNKHVVANHHATVNAFKATQVGQEAIVDKGAVVIAKLGKNCVAESTAERMGVHSEGFASDAVCSLHRIDNRFSGVTGVEDILAVFVKGSTSQVEAREILVVGGHRIHLVMMQLGIFYSIAWLASYCKNDLMMQGAAKSCSKLELDKHVPTLHGWHRVCCLWHLIAALGRLLFLRSSLSAWLAIEYSSCKANWLCYNRPRCKQA